MIEAGLLRQFHFGGEAKSRKRDRQNIVAAPTNFADQGVPRSIGQTNIADDCINRLPIQLVKPSLKIFSSEDIVAPVS